MIVDFLIQFPPPAAAAAAARRRRCCCRLRRDQLPLLQQAIHTRMYRLCARAQSFVSPASRRRRRTNVSALCAAGAAACLLAPPDRPARVAGRPKSRLADGRPPNIERLIEHNFTPFQITYLARSALGAPFLPSVSGRAAREERRIAAAKAALTTGALLPREAAG